MSTHTKERIDMTSVQTTEVAIIPTSIQEYEKTAAALAELDRRYKGIRYDVLTKDGLLAATKARAELRTLRIALEKTRVAIKAPALKRTQEIDTEARRLTAAICALEDPIDAQIKAEEMRKEQERLAAERAEQERIEAEQRAIREAEQRKIEEAQAEIRRRQDALDRAEQARREEEAEHRRVIEEQDRAARLRIEEEDRKARAIREEQDRVARIAREEEERKTRKAREEEEARLKAERDKMDAERRAVEEAQRKAREEEEARARKERDRKEAEQRAIEERKRKAREQEEEKQREIQRRESAVLDANAMLATFMERFGHLEEFAPVVTAITKFLVKGKGTR